jgi:hypothetical protein
MEIPNKLRIDLANSQRTSKGRDNWMKMALDVNEHECWSKKTEHDGSKIGDSVRFTDCKFIGGCAHLSMRDGKAFAFGLKTMLVVYKGKLRKVNLGGEK